MKDYLGEGEKNNEKDYNKTGSKNANKSNYGGFKNKKKQGGTFYKENSQKGLTKPVFVSSTPTYNNFDFNDINNTNDAYTKKIYSGGERKTYNNNFNNNYNTYNNRENKDYYNNNKFNQRNPK